jgi:hypothetical protein
VVLAGLGVDRKGGVGEDSIAIRDALVVGNPVVPGWSPGRAWLGRKGFRFPPPESTILLCSGRFPPSASLAKVSEQRLTGAAQTIIYPLAAAMRLYQLCGLEPQEVGRDRGGAYYVALDIQLRGDGVM